jgi:hypothetical protein
MAQDSGSVKFSTSLSELRAVATAAEQQRQNDLMGNCASVTPRNWVHVRIGLYGLVEGDVQAPTNRARRLVSETLDQVVGRRHWTTELDGAQRWSAAGR